MSQLVATAFQDPGRVVVMPGRFTIDSCISYSEASQALDRDAHMLAHFIGTQVKQAGDGLL
jgi:hypothetical protein